MNTSRRLVLQRLGLMGAAAGLPFPVLAEPAVALEQTDSTAALWRALPIKPVQASGYGTDPNLVQPLAEPWPRTLSDDQLQLLKVLSDILLPAQDPSPAASEIGVPDVVDHWLSAPYPDQQQHRLVILQGFDWLQREAARRYQTDFVASSASQQLAIVDDIAYQVPDGRQDLVEPIVFFGLLRRLVAGAYYSSPAGLQELGYQGNVPIAGDYPGPTDEALAHLKKQLDDLGLSL